MIDIIALLYCLDLYVTRTTLRQLSRIICAILAMSGRVTMLGVSRWAGKGGSYRSVQRFMILKMCICWPEMSVWYRRQARKPMACRFFSLYNRSMPGLAFFALSLTSTRQRR